MASGGYRAEGEPWLSTAEKLLVARDIHGARTFAIRARESYPRLEGPNQILAVVDTLIAAESLIVTPHGNHYHDWYAILQVPRFCPSIELIATQYRKLALLLNPERNYLPFADQSFKFVSDAWIILSNPARKMMYDNELQLSQFGERHRQLNQMPQQPQPQPPPPMQQQPARKSPRSREKEGGSGVRVNLGGDLTNLNHVPQTRPSQPEPSRPRQPEPSRASQPEPSRPIPADPTPPSRPNLSEPSARRTETTGSFWTACPYCFVLYEYQKGYEECVLRCQQCRKAFHAVAIRPPPVSFSDDSKDTYLCCWGYYPLGFNGESKEATPQWTPISPMFVNPGGGGEGGKSKPRTKRAPIVYEEVIITDSESDPDDEESDDEWLRENSRKKAKPVKPKTYEGKKRGRKPLDERLKKGSQNNEVQNQKNVGQSAEGNDTASSSGGGGSRVLRSSGRKQMGNGLDLNVEFNNEPEDPVANGQGVRQEHGDEDNIDGVGFFEGLDEFLSSLPILNVVKDDKVKPA